MSEESAHRWPYLAAGIFVMLLAGLVYAWTVFQSSIAASFSDWTGGQLSVTFTVTMSCFCLGGICSGMLQKKAVRARTLLWIAAFLFLVGFAVASQAMTISILYIGFGVCTGLATGLAYNVVMSVVLRWFPDKQGFVSGLLLMAFGFSGFLFGKAFAQMAPADGSDAWRMVFVGFGILLAVGLIAASFLVREPRASQIQAAKEGDAVKTQKSFQELSSLQMIKKPSFWLYFAWATLLTAAGLAVISQGAPLALEACPTLDLGTVATVVGLVSVCNGVGRIVSGAMFDRVGYRATMLTGCIAFVVAMALFAAALMGHGFAMLVAACLAVGLAYGFVPPVNSAFIGLFYGRENYPGNFALINVSVLVASFGSTIAGVVVDSSGTYLVVVAAVAIAAVLGSTLVLAIRPPREGQVLEGKCVAASNV